MYDLYKDLETKFVFNEVVMVIFYYYLNFVSTKAIVMI